MEPATSMLYLSRRLPSTDTPRPGPAGVITLPLQGSAAAESRSLSSSGPVASPWAKGCAVSVAARWMLAARPTPHSREEVTTSPLPLSSASRIISSDSFSPPSRPALITSTSALSATARRCVLSVTPSASSTATGIATERRISARLVASCPLIGSSTYSMSYCSSLRSPPVASRRSHFRLASMRTLISVPTAWRTAETSASSCFADSRPTFSLILPNPASAASLASMAASLGVSAAMRALTGRDLADPFNSSLALRISTLPLRSRRAASIPNHRTGGAFHSGWGGISVHDRVSVPRSCGAISPRNAPIASTSSRLPAPTGDASPTPTDPSSPWRNSRSPYRVPNTPCDVTYGLRNGMEKPCQETRSTFISLHWIGGVE